jgi:hypothetical protein
MDFNLTKLIKEMDKTMITDKGGHFKLVVTYSSYGCFDERAMEGRSRQSYQRHRALRKHKGLASMGSISWCSGNNQAPHHLIGCVSGKGYEIEYTLFPETLTPSNSTASVTRF